MANMTKCKNDTCPMKTYCHRYTMPPLKDQRYHTYNYEYEEGEEFTVNCDYFEHNHKRSFLRSSNEDEVVGVPV